MAVCLYMSAMWWTGNLSRVNPSLSQCQLQPPAKNKLLRIIKEWTKWIQYFPNSNLSLSHFHIRFTFSPIALYETLKSRQEQKNVYSWWKPLIPCGIVLTFLLNNSCSVSSYADLFYSHKFVWAESQLYKKRMNHLLYYNWNNYSYYQFNKHHHEQWEPPRLNRHRKECQPQTNIYMATHKNMSKNRP